MMKLVGVGGWVPAEMNGRTNALKFSAEASSVAKTTSLKLSTTPTICIN